MACTDCGVVAQAINGGEFHRDRFLLREWDVFLLRRATHEYWLRVFCGTMLPTLGPAEPMRVKILAYFPWAVRPLLVGGRGGDWVDAMLNFRYQF